MPAISVSFIISSRLFNKVYDKADMPTMQLIRMNESKSGNYVYMLVSMIKEKKILTHYYSGGSFDRSYL